MQDHHGMGGQNGPDSWPFREPGEADIRSACLRLMMGVYVLVIVLAMLMYAAVVTEFTPRRNGPGEVDWSQLRPAALLLPVVASQLRGLGHPATPAGSLS